MAVQATGSFAPQPLVWPAVVLRRVRAWFAAPRLDVRLAGGEDPSTESALAWRSAQLASRRSRCRLAAGLERLWSRPPERAALSAAIPSDWLAVEIARPALEQLANALRSRESVQPQGIALTQVLMTDPGSALYRPDYPDELYEVARAALLALGGMDVPGCDRACVLADAHDERSSPW